MLTKQTPYPLLGGIVALNREVDAATAEEMSKIFLEVIMAPAFTKEALDILEAKKNIRLIELSKPESGQVTVKKVSGGLLVQTEDDILEDRYWRPYHGALCCEKPCVRGHRCKSKPL